MTRHELSRVRILGACALRMVSCAGASTSDGLVKATGLMSIRIKQMCLCAGCCLQF